MPRGAISKRTARPFDQGGGASVVSGSVLAFARRSTDTNIAVNVYADLINQAITVAGPRPVTFDVTYAFAILGTTDGNVILDIDAVTAVGSAFHNPAPIVASEGSGSMRHMVTLAPGAHTIRVRWKVVAGQAFCRPATQLEIEHCTLTVAYG